MQSERLTKDNATLARLNELAENEAGLLGPYTRKEYNGLQSVDIDEWEFVFVPSKLDDNFGQLKLRPKTTQSTKLIALGRAKKLKERDAASEYGINALISFINAVKREPLGNVKKVQDFLLTHWREYNERFNGETPSNDEFNQWMMKFSQHRLKTGHIDTVQKLMPRVVSSMHRSLSKKKDSKR